MKDLITKSKNRRLGRSTKVSHRNDIEPTLIAVKLLVTYFKRENKGRCGGKYGYVLIFGIQFRNLYLGITDLQSNRKMLFINYFRRLFNIYYNPKENSNCHTVVTSPSVLLLRVDQLPVAYYALCSGIFR